MPVTNLDANLKQRGVFPVNRSARKDLCKPVQRRLLVPLAIVLLLVIGGFVAIMLYMHHEDLRESGREKQAEVSYDLDQFLKKQGQLLSALEAMLLRDASLIEALKGHDRDRLLAECTPIFRRLQAKHNLTHFYFHGADRVNLLRVHKPEKYGDFIDRYTARGAERTGNTASGIELGPLGTFTLRVVQPVFDRKTLIGYLELGKEIEDVLRDIHDQHDVGLVVAVYKSLLQRAQWEAGMKMLGRSADWDRFDEKAIIYSSHDRLTDQLGRFLTEAWPAHGDATVELTSNDLCWQVKIDRLFDASGTEVGDLIVLYNVTASKAAFRGLIVTMAAVVLVLLSALLGFLYIILRQTDRGIQIQQKHLYVSEERMRSIFATVPDYIFNLDRDGKITFVNRAIRGSSVDELIGTSIYDYVPLEYHPAYRQALTDVLDRGELVELETAVAAADSDATIWCLHRIGSMTKGAQIIGFTIVSIDITERKRSEEAMQRSETKFRTLYDSSSDAVMMLGEKRFFDCNNATLRMFGYADKEELCSKHPGELSPPHQPCGTDSMTLANERIATAMQKGSNRFEWMHRRNDGSEFFAEVLLNAMEIDKDKVLQAVVRDITERKQAEKELRENEERLKSILDSVQAGIIIVAEHNHEIVFANPAAGEMVRADVKDMVGRTCHEFICPAQKGKCPIAELGKTVVNSEKVLLTANGERLEVLKTVKPIVLDGQKCMIESFVDITERKQAEKELKHYRDHLEDLVQERTANLAEAHRIAHLGNWNWNIVTNKLQWSDEVYRIFALQPEEFASTYEAFLEVVHPDDRDYVRKSVDEAVYGKKAYNIDHRIVLPSGEVRTVHEQAEVTRDESGTVVRMIGTVQDITDRKLMEARIEQDQQNLQLIFDAAPLGMILVDEGAEIKRINNVAVELSGQQPEKLIGQRPGEALGCGQLSGECERCGEGRACLDGSCPMRNTIEEALRSETTRYDTECQVSLIRNGQVIRPWLEVRVVPISLEGKKHAIITISDITEKRRLESQSRQSDKLQSVGQLASGIAHEINTPIQYVANNLHFLNTSCQELVDLLGKYEQLLAMSKEGNLNNDLVTDIESAAATMDADYLLQEIPPAVEHSLTGVRNVAEIVKAMKEFAHPGSEDKSDTDINRCIDSTLTISRNYWKLVAELESDYDADLPLVPCMAGEINQVILNLIVNAADAIAQGAGDENGEKGTISIRTRLDGDWAEISVSDTGGGIPDDIKDKIYDPFFTTKEVGKGSGQGLAIARSVIVDKHGGILDCNTEKGRGTTFIIRLPLEPVPTEAENELSDVS